MPQRFVSLLETIKIEVLQTEITLPKSRLDLLVPEVFGAYRLLLRHFYVALTSTTTKCHDILSQGFLRKLLATQYKPVGTRFL